MTTHKATCHCGAVELAIDIPHGLTGLTRCDCSVCRRKGAVMAYTDLDKLQVVKGVDKLSLYTFNTHTAKHYFCSICGIYTHHQRRSNPNHYGVNVGCIEGIDPRDFEPVAWGDGVNHSSDKKS